MKPFIARWDLDKTYLRTEFATLRDLVRTAFERADQKRTVPGAASLLRELTAAGARVHILSGSPRQLRSRIEEKLRLDGARFETLTLKPNLENLLHFRWRALRDQLGFKLPALLQSRATLPEIRDEKGDLLREILVGDDVEADAFVYCLYADLCTGQVDDHLLTGILRRGRAYPASIENALRFARLIAKGEVVERIFIHLDRQSPLHHFARYGSRVVPFYNYFQPALVLAETGRLPPSGVVRVAVELVLDHRFDAEGLTRSYFDLRRRGLVQGSLVPALRTATQQLAKQTRLSALAEIFAMCDRLEHALPQIVPVPSAPVDSLPDYLSLIDGHNHRNRSK